MSLCRFVVGCEICYLLTIVLDACMILADSVVWTDLAPHVSSADQALAQLGLGLRVTSDNIFSVAEVAEFNNTLGRLKVS